MNKADLIALVADIADISARDAEKAVASVFEHITNALARGEAVSLTGFGSFTVRPRAARQGRNPKTGEVLTIQASNAPCFKAGKTLREAVTSG